MEQTSDIAGKIEKNRMALLRMVSGWLFLAYAFAGAPSRALPRRVSNFVTTLLQKVEKATYFLVIATAKAQHEQFQVYHLFGRPGSRDALSIPAIIARLKAIIVVLNALQTFAAIVHRVIARCKRLTALCAPNKTVERKIENRFLAAQLCASIELPAPP